MAPAPWTNNQIIAQIDSGSHWLGGTVIFGFPTSSPYWAAGAEGDGFSAFNAAQKDAACLALALWGDVAAIDLKQASAIDNPDITLQNTTTNIYYAHAYYPGGWGAAGSVWTNPHYTDLANPQVGKYGFMALMHEIGHALGLDHPGPYNGGSPTYNNDALYQQDTHQYTVMSYFSASNTDADWRAGDGVWRYAQTPMLDDILVLQSIYGTDTHTRAGNTVYGFHSTADRMVFDFTQNAHPILTIWDAGGTDSIDLSGFSSDSRLNLQPGTYSDADNMTHNIAIAFGAAIENGVGGDGNDTLLGNWLDNDLAGNGGHDHVRGRGGNDTLVGGRQGDWLNSGNGNDRLVGGIGHDRLFGGSGDDQLLGGRGGDHLTGGGGHDSFVFSNPAQYGGDIVTDFKPDCDTIDLRRIDANCNIDGNQAFHFIGSDAFSGQAGELRSFNDQGHTVITGDTDGDMRGDFQIELDGTLALHATDFML